MAKVASQNTEDKPITDLTDDEILTIVRDFRDLGLEGSANFYDRMRKGEDFVIGGDLQWDPAIKEANEAKGKFCLTIPLIKPQIKQVVGTQIQNPKDFKVFNTKGGSATIAKVLTALAKQAMDSEQAQFEKTQLFEAGLNTGSGQLGFFLDDSQDPLHKNIRVERLNEFEVLWDPNCLIYDPNTPGRGAKFCIWEPWEDKDTINLRYPDKKSELEAIGGNGGFVGAVVGAITSIIEMMVGSRNKQTSIFGPENRTDVKNLQKTRYQVSHTWWRKPTKCTWWYDKRKSEFDAIILVPGAKVDFVNSETGETKQTEVTQKMIDNVKQRAKDNPDFTIKETICNVMIHTIRVGDCLLENIVDELNLAQSGVCLFPVIPFYPFFVNGYKSGMSEDMIGTQEEINYAHSMELNIIKQLANTGYMMKGGVGAEKYAEFLKAHGGEDGVVLDKSKAGGELEKIQPSNYPTAIGIVKEKAVENLRQISNVRTEDPTTAKDRVASTIRLKQLSALTGSAAVFQNFDYTMSLAGNLIVEIIRNNDIFSEDEILEIVDKNDLLDAELIKQATAILLKQFSDSGQRIPQMPQMPPPDVLQDPAQRDMAIKSFEMSANAFKQFAQALDKESKAMATKMLITQLKQQRRRGRYNTKVDLSPMAPTARIFKSLELFELNRTLLQNMQMPIDRDILIRSTDVDNKEEIIDKGKERMKQAAAMAPQPARPALKAAV
ncbi:MAG: hypothetical protein PHH26_00725 [Candidatus Thermoplasmatota archaeon]|nr:hypothetical protein [Candidatus Thermoplasmatota archaeon]